MMHAGNPIYDAMLARLSLSHAAWEAHLTDRADFERSVLADIDAL